MSLSNELKSRWKPEYNSYGVVALLQKQLNQVLDSRDRLAAKRAELQANRDLSDEGRVKALKAAATAEASVTAKAGRALRWHASSGTRTAGVITTVARTGQQQRYWGVSFTAQASDE